MLAQTEKVAFFHNYIEASRDFPPKLDIISILLRQLGK